MNSVASTWETAGGRRFFGWRVVGAAFVVAMFAWGVGFYGPALFLDTLHHTRGWSVSLISAAITTHYLLGALAIASFAGLHARFGMAALVRTGGMLTAVGLLGWAWAREPWQLFLATVPNGAGWALTSVAALNAMVSPWFVRWRPAALSMAYNGASVGGVVFSPLWVALIAWFGFPLAATIVAVVLAAVFWAIAHRYLTRGPAEIGQRPDGDGIAAQHVEAKPAAPLGRPWRDRRFVTLAIGSTLALFGQIGLIAHLFSLLVPALDRFGAGVLMAVTTVCAVLGRTLLGFLMDECLDRRTVLAANLAVQAVGSLALIVAGGDSAPLLVAGCVLFGLGLGNIASLPSLIAQAEFSGNDVGRVVALVTATSQATFAFAPAGFGVLRGFGAPSGGTAPLLFAAAALLQLAAAWVGLRGRT